MTREKQIELLVSATERTDRRVADWMADKDVKAALRFYHETAKGPLRQVKRG
jgi:hypothetical protein